MSFGAALGKSDEHAPAWMPKLADDVGDLANPIGFDRWSFRRSPPWERGYGDGLRAGYEAALRAGVLSAGPPIRGSGSAAEREDADPTPTE
ncbi:hypothetical protein I601_4127 [Nocardioides dokdonensis FR1436]|uniref:Uncharacterized protein n=1 Tax=Nocardioides dokdonensis FR1436 TaxID=1300347 RepID=A0A1A9GSF1_9ACTN|nr:hypothetical protein [Nocardioides dokdonensis]ANH40522.1 hypothetical protein I601_4127 [Nocardioides dokdonensis FR1436]